MPLPFHSLENPFEKPRKRNPDDAALVGIVLGPEEEKAMREAMGEIGAPKAEPEEYWGDLKMSEEESKRVEEAEKREPPEQVRKRFVVWAEEFNLGDEKWIDETFAFDADGTVTVEKDLDLLNKGISYLPKGLKSAEGHLYLRSNQITSLKGLEGVSVGRNLNLYNNRLTSLKGLEGVSVGENLYLSNNKLISLEGLPKKIGGELYLQNIPATEIPEGLNIKGYIHVNRNQTALAEDIQKKYPGKIDFF